MKMEGTSSTTRPTLMKMLSAAVAAQSPYAGEQDRAIKSLSEKEVAALRRGAGMGMARPAELNRYPGPRHVLEHAEELELSDAQVAETQALFGEVRRKATELGEAIIEAEQELERMFARGRVDSESLEDALLVIGELRAKLRFVHLDAHLRQAEVLGPEQITAYIRLRGYSE